MATVPAERAGHGVQLGAANYLLPVDVGGDSEEQLRDEAIPLQRILDDMSEKKAKVTLAKTIGHDQVPAIYDQVVGEFFFLR